MKAKRFLEKPSTEFRLCDLRKILEPRFNVSGLLSVWLEYFMSVVYFPLANLKRFRSLSDSIISFFSPVVHIAAGIIQFNLFLRGSGSVQICFN